MGCVSTRSELTAEEATSHNLDLLLGYYNTPIEKVYKIHLKYSSENKISIESFKSITKKLNLFSVNPDLVQPILNFYTCLKLDMAHYSLKKLLIFGIVQSSGNSETKARLLFNTVTQNETISPEEIQELFKTIFDLVLKMLVKIRVSDFINEVTQHELRMYHLKLTKGVERGLEVVDLAYRVRGRELTQEMFVRASVEKFGESFFSGIGIREFLKANADG